MKIKIDRTKLLTELYTAWPRLVRDCADRKAEKRETIITVTVTSIVIDRHLSSMKHATHILLRDSITTRQISDSRAGAFDR